MNLYIVVGEGDGIYVAGAYLDEREAQTQCERLNDARIERKGDIVSYHVFETELKSAGELPAALAENQRLLAYVRSVEEDCVVMMRRYFNEHSPLKAGACYAELRHAKELLAKYEGQEIVAEPAFGVDVRETPWDVNGHRYFVRGGAAPDATEPCQRCGESYARGSTADQRCPGKREDRATPQAVSRVVSYQGAGGEPMQHVETCLPEAVNTITIKRRAQPRPAAVVFRTVRPIGPDGTTRVVVDLDDTPNVVSLLAPVRQRETLEKFFNTIFVQEFLDEAQRELWRIEIIAGDHDSMWREPELPGWEFYHAVEGRVPRYVGINDTLGATVEGETSLAVTAAASALEARVARGRSRG